MSHYLLFCVCHVLSVGCSFLFFAGTVTVQGCGSDSVQGDIYFAKVLEMMGATVTWTPNTITVTRKAGDKVRHCPMMSYHCAVSMHNNG